MSYSNLYPWAVAVSVALALALAAASFRRAGLRGSWLFLLLSALLGPFVGHLLYGVVTLPGSFIDYDALYWLQWWRGDVMLYGVALGALLAAELYAALRREKLSQVCDAAMPAAALLIGLCRLCEGLILQGIGTDVSNEALCFFPLAVFDQDYETWFYALFFFEGLYALLLSFLCKGEGRARRFWFLYACGQIVFESMRQDAVLRWGFVRCSQVISAALAFLLLVDFLRRRGFRKTDLWRVLAGLACLGVCLVMEFALEQRVSFLLFLDRPGCYGVMIAAVALIAVNGLTAGGEGKRA